MIISNKNLRGLLITAFVSTIIFSPKQILILHRARVEPVSVTFWFFFYRLYSMITNPIQF